MTELGENITDSQDSKADEAPDSLIIADTEVDKPNMVPTESELPSISEPNIKEDVTVKKSHSKEEIEKNTDIDVNKKEAHEIEISVPQSNVSSKNSAQNLISTEKKAVSQVISREKSAPSVIQSNQKLVSSHSMSIKQSPQSKSSKQNIQSESKSVLKVISTQSLTSGQKLVSKSSLKEKLLHSTTPSNQKILSLDVITKQQSSNIESVKEELKSEIELAENTSVQKDESSQLKESAQSSKPKLLSDSKSAQIFTTSKQMLISSEALSEKEYIESETSKQNLQPESIVPGDKSALSVTSSKQKLTSGIALNKKPALSVTMSKQILDASGKVTKNLSSEISDKVEDEAQFEKNISKEKQLTTNKVAISEMDRLTKSPTNSLSGESTEDPALAELTIKKSLTPSPSTDRESLIAQLRTLMNERSMLLLRNNMLQRRLVEYYKKRNLDHALREVDNIGGLDFEELYRQKLLAYEEMKAKEEEEIAEIERVLHENESVRDQHRRNAEEAFAQLQETERAVGIGLIDTRYGKRISDKVVDRLLSLQRSRAHDTSKLRLRWLRARNAAARLDQVLRALDTVAGGLHVADYHQLLLDSQTYMEKIEDREGELARYRYSCTGHGAAAAHAREKLRCMDERAVEALEERQDVEQDYREARDQLNRAKTEHDRLRTALLQEQRRAGLLGRRDLLLDYDNTLDELEILKERQDELQKECQKFDHRKVKRDIDEWTF